MCRAHLVKTVRVLQGAHWPESAGPFGSSNWKPKPAYHTVSAIILSFRQIERCCTSTLLNCNLDLCVEQRKKTLDSNSSKGKIYLCKLVIWKPTDWQVPCIWTFPTNQTGHRSSCLVTLLKSCAEPYQTIQDEASWSVWKEIGVKAFFTNIGGISRAASDAPSDEFSDEL